MLLRLFALRCSWFHWQNHANLVAHLCIDVYITQWMQSDAFMQCLNLILCLSITATLWFEQQITLRKQCGDNDEDKIKKILKIVKRTNFLENLKNSTCTNAHRTTNALWVTIKNAKNRCCNVLTTIITMNSSLVGKFVFYVYIWVRL